MKFKKILKSKKASVNYETKSRSQIHSLLRRRWRGGTEKVFEEKIAEKYPNLVKITNM